ncbi:polysaccharide deacetylase family protein [Marinobacter sp. F4216]|uniref:polysaccharide deacetylase family protein n=1 Tax=Marinobacter sp. F4216 TaxID=2874281 RepID=UPI001CBD8682|nr:polysaccharide deacetylase family protein [Marinobacter sp. F4216]MBZ2167736.1 polysaccharide deacetylase family protein [Marinobacter sp. F4216]
MFFRLIHQFVLFLAILLVPGYLSADLVVLQYHHVSDKTPPATSTSPSLFDAQMDMISRLGLEVVVLESGTQDALAGNLDEENRIALTFDDAYESVISNALPTLAEHNYPFTVFVNTQAIGSPGYLTWKQLEELAGNELVTLANHSADHGHLARRLDESMDGWKKRIEASLDQAQQALKTNVGTTASMFAYPYGEFDRALEQHIAERNWYGFGQHSGAIGPSSSPTRLPRFPMANAFGRLESLETKLLSRALPVSADQIPDSVIKDNPPHLSLQLPAGFSPERLNCFGSGMGRIKVKANDSSASIRASQAFDTRRFRYNCTYPDGTGRYYWLSQPWLDLNQPED